MANMSYCRFHNTEIDLDECLDALDYELDEDNKLSEEEAKAAKRMFKRFLDFCKDEELIEDYNTEAIDRMIDRISEPDEED